MRAELVANFISKTLAIMLRQEQFPLLIHPDGHKEKVMPANGTDFTLEEAQQLVGGLIEVVYTHHPEVIILINEEGKLMGLEENQEATSLWMPLDEEGQLTDFLVGPCLFMHTNMLK